MNPEEMKACLEAKRLGKKKPYKSKPPMTEAEKAAAREVHFQEVHSNLKRRVKNYRRLKEASDRKAGLRKEKARVLARLRELELNILRREANMQTALELFNKNKYREEKRIATLQDSLEKQQILLEVFEVKKKKAVPKPIPAPPKKKTLKEKIKSINKAHEIGAMEPPLEEVVEEIKELAVDIAVEQIEEPEDEGEIILPSCPVCNRIYKTDQWVKRHMKERHPEEYLKRFPEG